MIPGWCAQLRAHRQCPSVAGKEGNPNAAAYSAAKAGVLALTKSLGKELAAHDIAVNALTPSPAKTRILDQVSEEHIKYMLSRVPRGRFVDVEEAAAMVSFMVSDENSFTTGATFDLSAVARPIEHRPGAGAGFGPASAPIVILTFASGGGTRYRQGLIPTVQA